MARWWTADMLAERSAETTAPLLEAWLRRESSPRVRDHVTYALERVGRPTSEPSLKGRIQSTKAALEHPGLDEASARRLREELKTLKARRSALPY
jgi:hypothetical protein